MPRFATAAADGFSAVESLFPYAFGATDMAAQLRQHGLQQVLFNAPPGDWEAGERSIACSATCPCWTRWATAATWAASTGPRGESHRTG